MTTTTNKRQTTSKVHKKDRKVIKSKDIANMPARSKHAKSINWEQKIFSTVRKDATKQKPGLINLVSKMLKLKYKTQSIFKIIMELFFKTKSNNKN